MQYLELLKKGLEDFKLLTYGSANITIDNSNQWHLKTSKIAKEFFDYIFKE